MQVQIQTTAHSLQLGTVHYLADAGDLFLSKSVTWVQPLYRMSVF